MNRYIAFLRGINISGKNKIPMAELKKGFEEIGFLEVRTYLNSGNVIFSSAGDDRGHFVNHIEAMIKSKFGLDIPVYIISKNDLDELLLLAPDWWGDDNKEIYDNMIFVMPPLTCAEVFHEMGEPKKELEKVKDCRNGIFWSFSRKDYQKTNWWSKTASASISNQLTIRTASTVRKIVGM